SYAGLSPHSARPPFAGGPVRTSSAGVRERDAAVDVEDVARALAGSPRRGEVEDSFRDVRGYDVDLEGRSRAIMILELVRCDAVRSRALFAPGGVPDPRSLEDSVRVDGVDADPVGPELLREAPREMERGGLGGR